MLALVLVILILYVLYPIYQVYHFVRPPRFLLRSVSLDDYGWQGREVQFNTPDGLLLSGWYIPSQNRAAVILVHGYGGNRPGRRAALPPLPPLRTARDSFPSSRSSLSNAP